MTRMIQASLLGLLLGVTGCGDKSEADDTAADSGSDFDPFTNITYPEGSEILVYTGHGGVDGDGGAPGGVESISAHWSSAYGWKVRVKDIIPTKLDKYRAIILMAPGAEDEVPFSLDLANQFRDAMALGTRIIILADYESCGSSSVNNLMDLMGMSLRYSGQASDPNIVVQVDAFNFNNQVTTDLTALRFNDPCYLDPGDGGELLFATEDNQTVGVAQRLLVGGEVVMVGDFRFLDDTGYLDYDDNKTLADNLVNIEP
ncbi:MAG: hypothetical protein ACI8RZ_004745 [Myxococcota bacterium]|jgi:hypothetical protein